MTMEKQKQKKRFGGGEKVLIGCAVGCGVLVVLGILAAAFGAHWFFSPGEQIATDAIAGDDSLAVVHMDELADDPGAQALLTKVLVGFDEVNRRQQQQDLPESMRWISNLPRQSPSSKDLNMYIPKEVTVTLERPDDGDDPNFVVAANLRAMVRPIKAGLALIGRGEGDPDFHSQHRGHDVYRMERNAFVGFVENTLLFSDAASAMEQAIDRIVAGGEAAAPSQPLRVELSTPEGDWDAAGVLTNEDGLLAELLRDLEPGMAPDEAEQLEFSFGIDLVSADQATGRTLLECADNQQAIEWLMELDQRSERLIEEAARHGLELDVDSRVQGRQVLSELRLTGIEAAIDEAIEELLDTGR
ncbi:MAG: hypothetical protein GY856_30145 [bacterium]|nr:hypothetical protein [bacterium]